MLINRKLPQYDSLRHAAAAAAAAASTAAANNTCIAGEDFCGEGRRSTRWMFVEWGGDDPLPLRCR